MKLLRITVALLTVALLSTDAFAQTRGKLKITGKVVDQAGQPVEGADVRAAKKGETQPQDFSAKTNKRGEWTISGLAPGEWVIEAMKEGVGISEATETLSDDIPSKTIDFTLGKAAPPAPPDPNVEINAQHQKALELARAGNIADARKMYEELVAKYPAVYQLQAMLASMYAAENNAAKGLEHIKIALEKEPTNIEWQLLAAELMQETGDKEGSQKILDSIDLAKVKDPRAFINNAIMKINSGDKAQAQQAIELLTKLIAQFPSDPLPLYLRGRAYLVTTQLPEARADFEKYIATAPATAPQLADAKKLLDQLNKK